MGHSYIYRNVIVSFELKFIWASMFVFANYGNPTISLLPGSHTLLSIMTDEVFKGLTVLPNTVEVK